MSLWLVYSSRTWLHLFLPFLIIEISLLHEAFWHYLLVLALRVHSWVPWAELLFVHATWSFICLQTVRVKPCSYFVSPLALRNIDHSLILSLVLGSLECIEHLAWTHRRTQLLQTGEWSGWKHLSLELEGRLIDLRGVYLLYVLRLFAGYAAAIYQFRIHRLLLLHQLRVI